MLAEHLDDNAADSGESPERQIRPAGDPHEEFLNALAAVKRDVDKVVADFPMEPPTPNAAIQLSRKLRALYDTIEHREQKESPSIRADLSVLRDYALGASIAMPRLTGLHLLARHGRFAALGWLPRRRLLRARRLGGRWLSFVVLRERQRTGQDHRQPGAR